MALLSSISELIYTAFCHVLSLETVIAFIVSAPGVILATVISVQTIRNNNAKAINEFLSAMEKKDFIKARHYVYNYDQDGEIKIEDTDINIVINFFQHWGLLTKMKYLPKKVFETGAGAGVIRIYRKVEKYIYKYRDVNGDPTYANEFEWLYNEVLKIKKSDA